mmetsp:Transcript_14229/g.21746  ORF Transcript_14229/g.21746 Transcript_14229/m.21746 type:complete len:164 (+) Transcript_14229:1471-1962(+)
MVGDWSSCVYENNLYGGTDGPSISSNVPSSSSSVVSSGTPSYIPSAEMSSNPTDLPSPVPSLKNPCANLKRGKCKKACFFTKKPKKVKVCQVKKTIFDHDCALYEKRIPCREVEFCKFANGSCSHTCDGLKKAKCVKALFCKFVKVKNPCLGCHLAATCGPLR